MTNYLSLLKLVRGVEATVLVRPATGHDGHSRELYQLAQMALGVLTVSVVHHGPGKIQDQIPWVIAHSALLGPTRCNGHAELQDSNGAVHVAVPTSADPAPGDVDEAQLPYTISIFSSVESSLP